VTPACLRRRRALHTPFMPPRPPELLSTLPTTLTEPHIYLSVRQRRVCESHGLKRFVEHLPGWLPHRLVAAALGFGDRGIVNAIQHIGGASYVWATEFENVHTLWNFSEPEIVVDGRRYSGSEAYYQAMKPMPFDDAKWRSMRVDVMRTAVRAKFSAAADIRALLMTTHPHPLVSIKNDNFWGFDAERGGENKLAELLMELRDELAAASPGASQPSPTGAIFSISGNAEQTRAATPLLWSAILPHLPPLVQQKIAAAVSEADRLAMQACVLEVVAEHEGPEGGMLSVGGSRYPLTAIEGMRQRGELDALIVSVKPQLAVASGGVASADGADDDSSEAHSVLQRDISSLFQGLSLASKKAAPIPIRIEYNGQVSPVYAPPSLTGLQLKSKVIAELGLSGGFQDYFLRLDGTAFGSRTPVSAHPAFAAQCHLVLQDVGERPKAVGMT